MEQVRERLLELLHYQKNRLAYRKRTEIAVDIVRQLESEGKFPNADYAFDQGVLSRPLTEVIEEKGKHWVTEIERSRKILWNDQWQRVERVAEELKRSHPESFRHKLVRCRNGEKRDIWAFTKVVRLKKYGRKRLVIVHETSDLSDAPRFLLTDALHWDASRVFVTWSYRWSVEMRNAPARRLLRSPQENGRVFHEFSKQLVGFESAQLRNEEAVKRHGAYKGRKWFRPQPLHFCLSCVGQSALQQAGCGGRKSERFNLAQENESTIGEGASLEETSRACVARQRLYTLTREAWHNLLKLNQTLLTQGKSTEQVLEVMMPS